MKNPNLSKRYENFIKRVFERHVKGLCGINHFCVSLAYPDGRIKMLSPYPDIEEEYFNLPLAQHDRAMSAQWYTQWPIYFWNDPNVDSMYGSKISKIKESRYQFYYGTYLVSKLGDFHLIYGIAFPDRDPRHLTVLINNIEKIRAGGHFLYDMYREVFNLYSEGCQLPYVDIHKPFCEILDEYKGSSVVLSDDGKIVTHSFLAEILGDKFTSHTTNQNSNKYSHSKRLLLNKDI